MSTIVAPIHIEAVGLANLRFFAPPSGAREFPWLSVDDLHACLTLPRALRREFKQRLRSSVWKADTRAIGTIDGIVNIVPHYMAQGLIEAMSEVGYINPDLYVHYAKASAKALGKLTDGLSPPEMLDYIGAAWKASGGSTSDGGRS